MAQPLTLSDADHARVSAAVAQAEAQSSGEIVTIMADRSDGYSDVALVWSAGVALLALGVVATFAPFYLGLIDRVLGLWDQHWTPRQVLGLAATIASLKFIGMWLILLWRPLRLALTPAGLKHARVRDRAVMLFKVGAERRTTGRTGVLIYLSQAEHRAEIVADEAISSQVSPEVWGAAMAAMLPHLKRGDAASGLCAAIEQVGAVLAQHLPRAADDKNELPDRLIEV